MAARFRLSSVAFGLLLLLAPAPLAAQAAGAKPAAKPGAPPDDCKALPGGNAPIARLARLEGGLSVRNLELTYFGKPLFQFESDDYHTLETLWVECGTFDAETAPKIAHRLKALIDDAKGVRRDTLDWIRRTEAEAKALKPGQDGIEKIHDLWQQMLNREFQMTAIDMAYISDVLSKRRDALYAGAADGQRPFVSPFDPGPPEVRSLDGRPWDGRAWDGRAWDGRAWDGRGG